MPSERFIYFSSLPTELRLQIWHHALEPRDIDQAILWDPIYPRPPPPPLLTTTHESRLLILSLYTQLNTKSPYYNLPRPWLSPSLDTICIPLETFPCAPLFYDLAEKNKEFYGRAKWMKVWCEDLRESRNYIQFMVGRFLHWKERCMKFELLMNWRGVEEVVFNMDEDKSEGFERGDDGQVKNFKGFLDMVRWWYIEMGKTDYWADLNLPRVLRVVGRDGEVLGELVDGTYVAPLVSAESVKDEGVIE